MDRRNNFDLLRLLFASIVVFYHAYDLSFDPAYSWISHVFSARLAVEGFFAMSGCLIVRSYDRSRGIKDYMEKRARRILPAYWAALLLTLAIGIAFSTLPFQAFIMSPATWQYIGANLLFANFLHPDLPGLFTSNPVMSSVNGSLWTIKVEVMFYMLVPVMVLACRRLGKWQTLSGLFALSILYRVLCDRFNHPTLGIQLPGQLSFFLVGSAVYFYYEWFKRHSRWMWMLALSCYTVNLVCGWMVFRSIGIALGTMCVGLLLPCLGHPTKYGDFSYGIYVVHFPIIQTFIAIGLVRFHPSVALALIVISVGMVAVASWNIIEAPWLRRSRVKEQIASAAST